MTNTITLPRINSNILALISFILICVMLFLTVQLPFAQGNGIWGDPCEKFVEQAKLSTVLFQLAVEAMNLALALHELAEASGNELAIELTDAALSLAIEVAENAKEKAEEDVEKMEDCRELFPDPPYFMLIASNGCVSGGCGST